MPDQPGDLSEYPVSLSRHPTFPDMVVIEVGAQRFQLTRPKDDDHSSIAMGSVEAGVATWSMTGYTGLVAEFGTDVADDIADQLLAWSVTTRSFVDSVSGDGYALVFLLVDEGLLTAEINP